MKEYKIGEEFEYDGIAYRTVDDNKMIKWCNSCAFSDIAEACDGAKCIANERDDNNEVYFVEVMQS